MIGFTPDSVIGFTGIRTVVVESFGWRVGRVSRDMDVLVRTRCVHPESTAHIGQLRRVIFEQQDVGGFHVLVGDPNPVQLLKRCGNAMYGAQRHRPLPYSLVGDVCADVPLCDFEYEVLNDVRHTTGVWAVNA